MRNNGFSDIQEWAPFQLIGDNVTFHGKYSLLSLICFLYRQYHVLRHWKTAWLYINVLCVHSTGYACNNGQFHVQTIGPVTIA